MAQLKGGTYVGGDLIVATNLYANTLKSYVSTGTAPITINSTTLVTNLNADLLDGLHTATANTASTVVARDGSGNFSAGTITANLSGIATSVSNTLTRGSYLTGSNYNGGAAATWSVDATEASTVSKVVARDGSGDINVRLLRSEYANQSVISGAIAFRTNNSTDNFVRFCSDAAAIRAFIGAGTSSTTGTVTSVSAGNGMTFTTISTTGAVTMGTPSSITTATTNSVGVGTHSHALSGTVLTIGSTAISFGGTATTIAGLTSVTSTNFVGNLSSGTVSATTGSFSGLITSTVANGTTPMSITSTTKVANLNADRVDDYHVAEAATASTIVARNSSGYIYGVYYNSSRADEASAAASYIYDTSDGWMRKKSLANVKIEIVTSAAVITGLGYIPYNTNNPNGYTGNVGTVTSVSAGNGMNFTTITGSGAVTLGTPDTCSNVTTNNVSTTSHSHAITGFLTSVQSDTTPSLGGNLALNQKNIDLTPTTLVDGSYSGIVETGTVGEAVVFGNLLYYKFSDGKWWKAKADVYATTPATRIALGTIAANGSGLLLIEGNITHSSWSFNSNKIYLSTTTFGFAQPTVPSTTGNQIQVVGIGKTATSMYFKPSLDVGEK